MASTPADTLKQAGLRRTPTRVAALTRVEEQGRPLTHAELLADSALAGVDAITLYRTLATLEGARLVHRVVGLDGVWRYCAQPRDAAGCPANHVHFWCSACGAMACLLDQPMPRVSVPAGVQVHARYFLVHGRCAACAS